MHTFIVNASLQVLPLVQDRHPYEWVDEVIALIQQSGIKYEIGPFATVLEGSYNEVMQVFNEVNEHLLARSCPEWIASIQLQVRSAGNTTAGEKLAKFL